MEKVMGTRTIGWSATSGPLPELDKRKALLLRAFLKDQAGQRHRLLTGLGGWAAAGTSFWGGNGCLPESRS